MLFGSEDNVNTRFYRLSFSSCVFVRPLRPTVAEVFFQIQFYIFLEAERNDFLPHF